MHADSPLLRLALPTPLRRLFDYLPPLGIDPHSLHPGIRVRVPFGRTQVVGVLHSLVTETPVAANKLRRASEVLDATPLLPEPLFRLLLWAADYYHHPLGEVMQNALPVLLREGRAATAQGLEVWRLTQSGAAADPGQLARAPRQAALWHLLGTALELTPAQLSDHHDHWREPLQRLLARGWVEKRERPCLEAVAVEADTAPPLHPEQAAAVAAVSARRHQFQPVLLEGVTGSGKTEVYLRLIAETLAEGRQALVLVPEIGLTPQLLQRFRQRFAVPIAVLHSGLTDPERLCAWTLARDGHAPIVIGTRSAVFTPLARPGLYIVDEEHDASYKQQEGFRYSARDLGLVRARDEGVPIVLGSATPSLESLHQAQGGRYLHLRLTERAGGALAPHLQLLDIRSRPLDHGVSEPLLAAMQQHLGRGEQVLLFLNRRGYAPVLICHDCGWVSHCPRCDANLTYYRSLGLLRCHHCGSEQRLPPACPGCGSVDLRDLGQGTEKIEQALQARLPDTPIVRIDRDSTRRKGSLERLLEQAQQGEPQVLLGTQMLAKGHHFPLVTLVGILDADQGLFSADLRAAERMAQLIVQVAGRAGRAERPGRVLIQTHHPDHPLLNQLVHHGYPGYAEAALAERRLAEMPPFSYLALVRAEAASAAAPQQFLQQARDLCDQLAITAAQVWGPVPAPMERRAGRYRAQLLIQSNQRPALHRLLQQLAPALEALPGARKVRWSLDVDPTEMY